jgi:hypothetical protein
MGKRDLFWDQVPTDADGHIQWPDDSEARAALVRDVFGAKVIGALEAVLSDQLEVVEGKPPSSPSSDYQIQAARRRLFAAMTEEQRTEIRHLLKEVSFGALYWILVKLEHFPSGDVDIVVEPQKGMVSFPPVGIEQTELHHAYFDWVERFSDLGDKEPVAAQPGVAADGAAPRR